MQQEITERTAFEAEVAPGLEPIAQNELRAINGVKIYGQKKQQPGAVRFSYQGPIDALLNLKTIIAVYTTQFFDIPRPKALLGHQYFQRLQQQLDAVLSLQPDNRFETLYLNAAGADSSVMQRILNELASHTGLQISDDEGDLLLRIRRAKHGWETLVRITKRPLATRSWRVTDMPGALNASVAHAILKMLKSSYRDTFLNIACGSGTFLIERADIDGATVIGCDINPETIAIARQNIDTAGYSKEIHLLECDARCLPLPDSSINKLCADLPFGHHVGSHDDNRILYPALLEEAARVAMPEAHFAIITHEITLMERILRGQTAWQLYSEQKITLSGLHPHIYLLIRQ